MSTKTETVPGYYYYLLYSTQIVILIYLVYLKIGLLLYDWIFKSEALISQ